MAISYVAADRDIDADETLKISAITDAQLAALHRRHDLSVPDRSDLSSELWTTLRRLTPSVPRGDWRPLVVAAPVAIAAARRTRGVSIGDVVALCARVFVSVRAGSLRIMERSRPHAAWVARGAAHFARTGRQGAARAVAVGRHFASIGWEHAARAFSMGARVAMAKKDLALLGAARVLSAARRRAPLFGRIPARIEARVRGMRLS